MSLQPWPGAGTSGSTDDTGTSAKFNSPYGIALDTSARLPYVADYGNYSIRKIVISTGVVTTVAGNGTSGRTDSTGPRVQALVICAI